MKKISIILCVLITCVCVAYAYSAGQEPAVPPMPVPATGDNDYSRTAIFWTLILGFVGSIATQIFKILDDRRKREWDLQDRKLAREELAEAAERTRLDVAQRAELTRQELITRAELQRIATIQTAVELTKVSETHRKALLKAIAENTTLTEHVSHIGNDVLAKLKGAAVIAGEAVPQLEDIATVGEDTNKKVTELQTQLDEVMVEEKEKKKE